MDRQAEDSGAEDEEPASGDGLGHQVRDVYVSGYLVQGDGPQANPHRSIAYLAASHREERTRRSQSVPSMSVMESVYMGVG